MDEIDQTNLSGSVLIDPIADWLMAQALGDTTVEALFENCCLRLRATGIPVSRARLMFRTLHPLFSDISLTWRHGGDVGSIGLLHGQMESSEDWIQSPFHSVLKSRLPFIRRHLIGENALLDFPVLPELRDQGATDYLAYRVAFSSDEYDSGDVDGIVGSWTTDRSSGFSDHDILFLLRVQKRLAVACKVIIKDQIKRNILTTYLGPDAGRQVMNGSIKRGDGETIHAVIWYNDLRNSTPLAESMPADDFLGLLNSYFECTAGAVLVHGGEVLRFIGDAVLAIFPIRDGGMNEKKACEYALAAARDAEERMKTLNSERAGAGEPELGFGLGLHVGDVMYGNIGVPERLEFSVIGTAANEAARLEALTKELDRHILVSSTFAEILAEDWEPLGAHKVRGVDKPITVFSPPNTKEH